MADDVPAGGGGINQDPRERREIRHNYRKLIERTHKNKEDLVNPKQNVEEDGLYNTLREADKIFKKVKNPREAVLDSQLMAVVSELAKQRANALDTDFYVFQPVEFAKKLTTYISGERLTEEGETGISSEAWERLGEAVQPFFNRSPALHFMFGSFDRGPRPEKVIKEKVLRNKDDKPGAKTKLTQVENASDIPQTETTTEEVERLHDLLKKIYQEGGRNPFCFFEFVINPHSFGQTVENLFYTSFLVKDGYARVFLDEDKLPVIEPIERAEGEHAQNVDRHQVIVTINKQEWQELIQTFNIVKPLIPTRKPPPGFKQTGPGGNKR